jgi:hypothetical protein
MEELHTDSIDGGHEASYGTRSRARERAQSNKYYLFISIPVMSIIYARRSLSLILRVMRRVFFLSY